MNDIFCVERPFSEWEIHGFANRKAHLYSKLTSTHRYSKENISEFDVGDVLVADAQSSGRGRHERTWLSPEGKNLYFNILFSLEGFLPLQYPQLMQITAISLAQFFRTIGVNASVKWPNDILCEKKKFCGMISEILVKDGKKILTIGIGIDVNATAEDLEEIERPVTSLRLILGKALNREILLQKILQKLEESIEITRVQGIAPWIAEWRKMDQFIGHSARIVEGNEVVEGTILDINEDGSLLFRKTDGSIVSRYTGDLEI